MLVLMQAVNYCRDGEVLKVVDGVAKCVNADAILLLSIAQWVGLGVLALFGLIVFFSSFFTVHTMQAGIVERLGKFLRIADAGLNFKFPLIDKLVYTEDLAMQLMDIKVQSKTKDDATVTIPIRVQYYVLKEKIKEAYYQLDDPEKQINAHVANVILSYIPKLDLDETYKQEDDIANRIKKSLTEVMEKFGYAIENALVTQIIPDQKVVDAMNDINAARREKVATEARAESEKIMKVKSAEADAEAKALQGQGVARQRLAIIKGLEESVDNFTKAVKGVDASEVLAIVMMTNYFDALRDIGSHSNTILFPHSPSAVGDLMDQIRNSVMMGNLATKEEKHGK